MLACAMDKLGIDTVPPGCKTSSTQKHLPDFSFRAGQNRLPGMVRPSTGGSNLIYSQQATTRADLFERHVNSIEIPREQLAWHGNSCIIPRNGSFQAETKQGVWSCSRSFTLPVMRKRVITRLLFLED